MRETSFAEPLSGKPYESGMERTLAWAAFDLTNRSKRTREVTLLAFHVANENNLRPKLSYRDGAVIMKGSALFASQQPAGFTAEFSATFPAGEFEGKEAMLKALGDHQAVFNTIVVRGRISAGKTARIVFNRVFDFPGALHWKGEKLPPVEPEALTQRSFDEGLAAAFETWRSHAQGISRFKTPDPVLNDIVRKAMLDGYFLTKRWEGRYLVFDSTPKGYLCQWDDASTKWFYTLDLMGDHATCEKLLDTVFERQGERKPNGTRTHEGCFSDVSNATEDGSSASWGSCNGWALWSMAEHARLTNDRAWLKKHKDKVLAGCEWIIRERGYSKEEPDNPCAGLLRGRFSCDSGDVAGHLAYTDSVSYLGLHGMAQVLADWGHAEGERLLEEAEAYRQDIVAAVDRVTDKSSDPWHVPRALSDPADWGPYSYGNTGPINLAFGGVLPADDERIGHVIRWLIDKTRDGSVEAAATGNMFYNQDLAVVLLELGRVEDFLRIFYTLLAANISHETLTTGEWRGNAQPHIHSISSLVRMFRTMLMQERDGKLYLLQGIPRRWLADGQEIKIEEAPTWYGPLSLRTSSEINNGHLTMELSVPERIGKTEIRLRLRLPEGMRMTSATVNGQEHSSIDGEWIVLQGVTGEVRVEASTTCD